jgi:toluene monooxygenase electron transfer component
VKPTPAVRALAAADGERLPRTAAPAADAVGFAIALEDGTWFPCAADETLLRAALRHGVGFPYECNSGGCGSCTFELLDGAVDEVWPQAPGLSPRAREAGRLLACQCRPTADCTVRARIRPQYVPPVPPTRMSAVLETVRTLTHDMALFRLRTPVPAQFLPGQYAMLSLPGSQAARAYSMCNIGNAQGDWDFIVKRVPGGAFSEALFGLREGAAIAIDGPYGVAFLREESPRDVLCIAGGAGLSPMLSILRGAAVSPSMEGRELHFFYGGRAPRDLCHEALFAEDATLAGRVLHHSAISAEPEPDVIWEGQRGFIHDVVEQRLGGRLKDFEIYLSGPPPMTDAVQRMLVIKHRVPTAQIHFDRFF